MGSYHSGESTGNNGHVFMYIGEWERNGSHQIILDYTGAPGDPLPHHPAPQTLKSLILFKSLNDRKLEA